MMSSHTGFLFSRPSVANSPFGYDSTHDFYAKTPQTQRIGYTPTSFHHGLSSPLSAYAPLTPSPLRELKNVNIMSTPMSMQIASENKPSYDSVDGDAWNDEESENYYATRTERKAPTVEDVYKAESSGHIKSIEEDELKSQMQPFTFSSNAHSQLQSDTKVRSRHQTPQAQLSNQATQNRKARKSQFMSRVRNQRAEDRDDRIGDQLLRGEYLRQKKSWENFYARQAESLEFPSEEESDGGVNAEGEAMGIPEDLEMMEEEIYAYQDEDEMDDAEYDRLFMEVLSQQQQKQSELSYASAQQPRPVDEDTDLEMT